MRRLVLDTSVAVAWYLPEEFATAARRWQARMNDGEVEFVVPSLHYWEFGNVLRTYVMRGELDPALAREAYLVHLAAPLEVREPDRAGVLDTALRMDSTVYDAVYITLAATMGLPLLTGEKTTRPWITRLKDKVVAVR